jgi:hypothetical protein
VSTLHQPPATPGALLCPRCGGELRTDQAWCLECGLAARTRVHPPPNWRLPIVVTGLLLALVAAGISFGLVALLDEDESPPPTVTVTVPAATAPAPVETVPTTTVPTTTVPTTTAPATPTTTTPPGGIEPTSPGGASPDGR